LPFPWLAGDFLLTAAWLVCRLALIWHGVAGVAGSRLGWSVWIGGQCPAIHAGACAGVCVIRPDAASLGGWCLCLDRRPVSGHSCGRVCGRVCDPARCGQPWRLVSVSGSAASGRRFVLGWDLIYFFSGSFSGRTGAETVFNTGGASAAIR